MEIAGPLIAVIDDEAVIRRALVRLLRGEHYRAEGFDSGLRFLAALSIETPRCVILDVEMPVMSGVELQQRLLDLGLRVPVIVVSAHDDTETRQRCLALGAQWYFRKPVEGKALLEAVRVAVGIAHGPQRCG
jgi:FixJ family two-component response regulator